MAPSRCCFGQEPGLVESLRSLLHEALHRGLLHLSAEVWGNWRICPGTPKKGAPDPQLDDFMDHPREKYGKMDDWEPTKSWKSPLHVLCLVLISVYPPSNNSYPSTELSAKKLLPSASQKKRSRNEVRMSIVEH